MAFGCFFRTLSLFIFIFDDIQHKQMACRAKKTFGRMENQANAFQLSHKIMLSQCCFYIIAAHILSYPKQIKSVFVFFFEWIYWILMLHSELFPFIWCEQTDKSRELRPNVNERIEKKISIHSKYSLIAIVARVHRKQQHQR